MPLNPIDETLDELDQQAPLRAKPAPRNPFEDTLASEEQNRTKRLEIAGKAAETTTPDRAAEVKRLSTRTGLPSAFIDRNFDEISKRAKQVDTPYAQMLRETPALAEFLEDPTNTAIVGDDAPQLGVLDRTLRIGRNLIGAAGAGVAQFSAGAWGFLRQQSEAALLNPNLGGMPIVAGLLGRPGVADFADATAHTAAAIAERMRGRQAGAGFVESSIYSGVESIGMMAPATVMALLGGGEAVMLSAMGATTSGLSYQEARDQGVDPGKASLYAALDGAIEVATEMIPVRYLIKDIAGSASFLKLVTHQAISELPGEQIATVLQDLNAWGTLPANKDRTFADYLDERPSAAAQTLISTITMVALTAGAGHGTRRMLEKLGAVAETSETFKRSPEAVAEFVAKAAEQGATTLYQDVTEWAAYWQEQGVDPRAKATEITGDPNAYDNAVATGQDLAIPMARYAVTLAGTEHNAHFADTLRIDAGETTGAQADEKLAALLADEAVVPDATEPAMPEGLKAIRTDLVAQLRKAGYDATAAATNVDVVMRAANLALRAGLDPVETLARYGLKVQREDLDVAAPPQASPAGPAGTSPAAPGDAPAAVPSEEAASGGTVPLEAAASLGVDSAPQPDSPSPGDVLTAGLQTPAADATLAPDGQAQADGSAGATGTGVRSDPGGGDGVPGPAAEPVAAGPAGLPGARGRTSGEATRGIEQVPASWRPYFTLLVDDARANGFAGDVNSLAEQFLQAIADSERAAADLNRASSDDVSPRDLLEKIVKLGGLSIEEEGGTSGKAGMVGELEHFLDSLTRQGKGVNPKTFRAAPKQFTHVGKIPGGKPNEYIVRRKGGGHSVDRMREMVQEDPRWESRYESISEFLQDIADAIAIETGMMKAPGKEGAYSVEGILQGVYDVRPGSFWWALPLPAEFTLVDTPGILNNASGESAASAEAISRQRSMAARGETFVVYGRDGVRRVLIGPEAVDYAAQQGETYGIEGPDGFRVLDDLGGAHPMQGAVNMLDATTFENEVKEAGAVYDIGDTSFDFTEFEQRDPDIPVDLFTDILSTGEKQPRLPGAENVRDQEVAQPAVADFQDEFRLTPPAETQAKQTTLFQESQLTQADVNAWANDLKAKTGPDLVELVVKVHSQGHLYLAALAVSRGGTRAGVGSAVMQQLTKFADAQGRRIVLLLGDTGTDFGNGAEVTESRAALVKFYKRFGFVLNEGVHKITTTNADMYREPTLKVGRNGITELFQPVYHGSPHVFDKFSLQKIGSGEGHQAYGWGLYFTSQREIAEWYRDKLSPAASVSLDGSGPKDVAAVLNDPTVSAAEQYVLNAVINDGEIRNGKVKSALLARSEWYDSLSNIEDRAEWALNMKAAAIQLAGRIEDVKAGRLYAVEIPEDDVMLHWDLPASEQPPKVQEALRQIGVEWQPFKTKTLKQLDRWLGGPAADRLRREDVGIRRSLVEAQHLVNERDEVALRAWQQQHQGYFVQGAVDTVGERIYEDLGRDLENHEREAARATGEAWDPGKGFKRRAQMASAKLAELGVVGIKYLDGSSRRHGEGTSNYVIFDDKLAEITEFYQPVGETTPDSPAFKNWFRQSKVVDADGKPLVVHHGTSRGDRVGSEFKPNRATSGPMAFFTDTRAIAEKYSTSKSDTSLDVPDDYAGWFKFKPRGSRSEIDLDRAWYHLTPAQQADVIRLLPEVGYENPDAAEGAIVAGSDSIAGKDHIDYLLQREARGNGLKAAKELWLNSGSLFGQEERFLEVLAGLGLGGMFKYDSPYATDPKVFDVYLSIQNPLITNAMPDSVVDALEKRSRRQRAKPEEAGDDLWDKRRRDPKQWIAQLKEDNAAGTNSMVWTSIPDWVTDTLRSLGYDGIRDTGGKMGGEGHDVWIPFDANQVKSIDNVGTFDPMSNNILRQKKRGAIRFGADRQMTIALFDDANLSTFIHEAGHFYLEVYGDVIDALRAMDPTALNESQQKLLADYSLILSHLGVESREQIDVEQHEKFARSFEAYLMEGKAPSEELRSAFARVRAWMLDIYQSLKALRVNLSPEVRGVFERMLASDAEIFQVEQAEKVQPMFLTAEQAGKTEAEFRLYREEIEAASQVARENLEAKVLGELRREQKAEWKSRRQEIETAVRAEVEEMPVYKATVAMQRGTTPGGEPLFEGQDPAPMKLNKEALVAQFGKDRLKRLPRPYIYETDGQHDADIVAVMFGFTSADEMLAAVENAAPMADKIRYETSQRMLAEHGSVLLDGRLHERARAAVANDRRASVIRSEMLALRKLEAKVRPIVQAGEDALEQERKERAYERRWFEAETKLAIALAKQAKQPIIDGLRADIRRLKAHVRGGRRQLRENIPSDASVREAARRVIARLKVRDLKPGPYWHASRRAAQLAIEAAAGGNYNRAVQEKGKELLNLALFRMASDAIDDVQARVQKAKDMGKGPARARIGLAGGGILDQVDGILDRFNFATVSQKALDRRANLAKWIAEQEGEGNPVNLTDEILDEQRRVPYQELTYEAFLGVTDGLDHLAHLARLKNKLLKSKADRELNDVAQTIADSIAEHAKHHVKTPIETRLPQEAAGKALAGFAAWQRKLSSFAREMDGGKDGGPVWEYLVRPVNDAVDAETVEKEKAALAFIEAVKGFTRADLMAMNQKVYVPEISDSLTRAGMIMVALNWGNEGNRQRLLSGYRWTEQQGKAILDRLDAADWRFVKASWAQVNSYGPQIVAKQTRVYGVAPEMVEPAPFDTRFGQMPGGYFPAKYDQESDPKAYGQAVQEMAAAMMAGAVTNATTRRGHTKARASKVIGRRVQLDFSVIWQHVADVVHDLTHHEMLIDVNRLLRHPLISTAIREHYGMPVYREIQNAIKDVAAGDIPVQHHGERALEWMRQGTSIARMGWNLMTSIVQPLGASVGFTRRIGPVWMAKGLSRFLGDASRMENTVAWIHGQSDMMRLRHKTQSREIAEVRNKIQPRGSWALSALGAKVAGTAGATAGFAAASSYAAVEDSFFRLISASQSVADTWVWLGEYEKASADKSNDDARVIALADQAVLDTQGSGQIKDLAHSMRGTPALKVFSQFMGYFSVVYNQGAEAVGTTRMKNPAALGRLAVDLLMLYTVPMLLEEAIRSAVRGDDDKDEDGWLLWFAKNQASYLLNTVMFFREFSGAVEGYRYKGAAGAGIFAEATEAAVQVGQAELDEKFWTSLNNTAGIVFHYPATQVERMVRAAIALEDVGTAEALASLAGRKPKKD